MRNAPILMSRDNPTGWKLEDLLEQVREEVQQKTYNLADDESVTAKVVSANNRNIMSLLNIAESYQRNSIRVLANLRPDQGPLGTPRIGRGSESETDLDQRACGAS